MTSDPRGDGSGTADPPRPAGTFGRTLLKVMSVQVLALILLWLLQARYAG